jgi:uncharacterized Zn finger protein (UPF0148 family)
MNQDQASMPSITSFCLKCKARRAMAQMHMTALKNGAPVVRGQCEVCGTVLFKIGSIAALSED